MEQDALNRTGTHTDLIASNRVEGTTVYDRSGEKLGTISHFMVSKRQGNVSHAVLSFGGLFGMGGDEHTLPWDQLDYDTDKGGYVIDLTKEQLEGGPRYSKDRSDDYDRDYYEGVNRHYGSPAPIW